ncbi:MAG TPA: hypothetical protein VEK10_00150 [Steroidobacteraceae bacterium]|nr:hypothetical protein [Steroidobacteraceae bacterium]
MRKLLPALLLLPAVALASSAFDGTWKLRTDSVKTTGKADQFQVLDGTYTCSSCVPEVKVKADGTDQKVEGHPYYDTVAVTVVSPSSIHVVDKQGGKLVISVSYEVSTDGKTLTGKFQDYTGSQVATGTFTETRRAQAPPGSHRVSGSWQPDQLHDANEAVRTYAYQMTNDQFSMHWNGQSYNAKFDGKQYPIQGDPGKTVVTLKRMDDHNVQETDSRDGKVTDEIHLAAAKDGQSIEVTDNDVMHHQITTFTLEKQQ